MSVGVWGPFLPLLHDLKGSERTSIDSVRRLKTSYGVTVFNTHVEGLS